MRFTSALSRHGHSGPTGSVGLPAPGEPVVCVGPAQLLGEASWHGGSEALGQAVVRLVPAQFLARLGVYQTRRNNDGSEVINPSWERAHLGLEVSVE